MLKGRLIAEDDFTWKLATSKEKEEEVEVLRYVGGVDISFSKEDPSFACGTLVVLDTQDLQVVYDDFSLVTLCVPYVPGFLAFREAPVLLELLERMKNNSSPFYPQMGVLYPKYEFRIIYDAASKFEAKVDTVLKNKIWVWKPARCEEFVSIQSQLGLIKMKIRCSGLLTNQEAIMGLCLVSDVESNWQELMAWSIVHLKGKGLKTTIWKGVPFELELIGTLLTILLMVDGNGILHPQGFGLACHLGVLADLPTIGIGKNLHHVDGLTYSGVRQLLEAKENCTEDFITLTGCSRKIWGVERVPNASFATMDLMCFIADIKEERSVLLPSIALLHAMRSTKGSLKPIFISVGHRVSLDTAITIAKMTCKYRVPEPVRQSLVMVHYLFKELVSNQVIIGGLLLAQQLEKLHGA
uniref:Endonuclease V n=1 Tax=Fagus sylvatica TaxID=28930 RepID=A0A2N9ERV9_FAGSY